MNNFEKGVKHYEQGDYESAIRALSDAICLKPENLACFVYRGCAYRNSGDFENALSDFVMTNNSYRQL